MHNTEHCNTTSSGTTPCIWHTHSNAHAAGTANAILMSDSHVLPEARLLTNEWTLLPPT